MTDLDRIFTREMHRLRRRILRVYGTARREMTEQLTEFLEHYHNLDAYKRAQLEAGKITESDYRTWLRNQVFQSELMHQKLDNITQTCTTAQQTAYKLARDEQYDIFALGANWAFYELEQAAGVAFNLTLYNTEAVKRLLLENPKLVPNKRIKSESNRTYDARVFNRYVTKGIIQGKSVHDIATQAVKGMADTEVHWAMNNAITALTGAQNAGTMQQLRNAEAIGIEVKKRWNSTLDYRTREMHRLLDQETADLDEPFKVQGYEIQYPGDPNAAPEMVYHCRCKLTSFLPRYPRRSASRRDNTTGEVVPAQSYEEWYEGKKKRYSDLHLEAKPVTMQSISNVKSFNCETLDGAKQRQLQNAHKRLLMTAAKQRPGVEVGRVFDTNMKPLTNDIEGKPDGHSVKLPDQNVPYIAIHTHPACGIFSHGDIFQFAQNDNLKLLTAIGHNGHIYAIEKTTEYRSGIVSALSWRLMREVKAIGDMPKSIISNEQYLKEAERIIRNTIKEMENYGVKFYE